MKQIEELATRKHAYNFRNEWTLPCGWIPITVNVFAFDECLNT